MSGSYIGKQPQYGFFEKQRITTANGSLTEFPLSFLCADSNQLLVSVGGVIQEGGQAYSVLAGAPQQIKFTEAPANGVDIFILFLGKETTGPRFSSGMLTDQAAITSLDPTDDFLVYDATASALKKVNYQYVHSGVANMPGNTVKVRDNAAAGAPSDKVVVNTEILIGDGTGFTAASLSSDVTMTNAGAVTIEADAVTYAKMQNLATANRVLGSATTGVIGEVQVATDMVADNAVTLAKMAGLVRGKIIYGDASGDPAALTVGTADQVLTSDGTDVSWADSVGGAAWVIKTACIYCCCW